MAATYAPNDDDRASMIELDLDDTATTTPEVRASAPAVAAPAITAPPVAESPLVIGRALLTGAPTVVALKAAAHATTDVCVAAGITDKDHPTRAALRGLYLATVVWFTLMRNLAGLRTAIEQRPELVGHGFPPHAAPVVADELTPSVMSLEAQLGVAATEGAANADTHGAGSLAAGSMRGVGYSDAAGYVRALQLGVKAGTATSYQQTLRSQYGYTDAQIAALTVTIIPEGDLPVGAGITHTPAGKSVADMTRAEAQAHFAALNPARAAATAAAAAAAQVIRETADAATVALAQRLIVDDSPLAWWESGWSGAGAGHITIAELTAACGEAPDAKVNSTQLARTVDSLRGTHDASMVAVRPAGVKVRWQIGRGKQHAAYVGAEYGTVLAIVDLLNDNTLSFDGDATIADEVRAEYARLCGNEVLRPGDVTAWLSQVLRKRFGAVRNGDRFLVSPMHKDAARELCGKIAKVWAVGGWVRGRLVDGVPELGITYQDVATVIGGLWQGLSDEVTEAEARWVKTVADVKVGAKVGLRAAQNELDRLDGVKADGTDGLRGRLNELKLIGEGPLAPLRARVVALRVAVKAAWDDASDPTSQRAMLLDMT
jgi:hypothetical protein